MLHLIVPLLAPLLRLFLPPTGRHRAGCLRRQRRRVLVLATFGIDLGPRIIHGREVSR
ncbi:hypothetical protein [Streptomyces sp. NPDC086023]|uniref:hypothetical protein n=1 Tax=Streptomyces sp. NPDC086023 TaxID=3365746 RepID=UPI0037D576A0